MRKLFTFAVVLTALCMTIPTQAQIKFGLKGGLSTNTMSFNKELINTSNCMGFFIGPSVMCIVPLVGIGVDVSALYDQREVDVDEMNGGKLKQQAIAVPINLRYNFDLADIVGIYIAAGPQFGFNVGKKSNILHDMKEWSLKSSTTSVNVGLGVILLNHLQVGANYNIACGKSGDVTDPNHPDVVAKGHWNTWQVSAAYYF